MAVLFSGMLATLAALLRALRALLGWPSPPAPAADPPRAPTAPPVTKEAPVPDPAAPALPFPADRKRIIKTIVGVFETGPGAASGRPDYGAVTVLDDGAGITFGAHQATDGGESSLDKIVARYIDKGGALAADLAPYVERLAANATAKAAEAGAIGATPAEVRAAGGGWVGDLMEILEEAGDSDPIMALAQEEIFESHYWRPAAAQAAAMGLALPLSWLVCYDSTIHSGRDGISRIRAKFPEAPPSGGGDEHAWTVAYLQARRAWLAGHSRAAVRGTVYRIDSLLDLAAGDAAAWDLAPPVAITKPRCTVM